MAYLRAFELLETFKGINEGVFHEVERGTHAQF